MTAPNDLRWPEIIPSTACGSPLRLTIKRGPHSGATAILCTCGWDRTYPTVAGARRALGQHIKTSGATYSVKDVRPAW